MALLTAAETASRLGVKLPTVYAYVSRGLLDSSVAGDRTSRFDSRQVERLARRGRPRLSSHDTSINLLINTSLTTLSERGVAYRGIPVSELIDHHTFEDIAELLWTGQLPTTPHRPWPSVPLGPFDLPHDQQIRVICSMVPPSLNRWTAPDPGAVAVEARGLIGTVVDSLTPIGHLSNSTFFLGGRRIKGSIASRLWPRLTDQRPNAERLHLLNTALIVMADHELATSTLAVRVAASTLAAPSAAVLAGLGAMQGSLHGAASRLVREVLIDAAARGPLPAVRERLARKERIAGFGHRVYAGPDPRAVLLFDLMEKVIPNSRYLALSRDVIAETVARTGKHPNIDVALAALELALGMNPHAAETIFTVARMSGWIGHALEEYNEPPIRFRARAHYIGPPVGSKASVKGSSTVSPRGR